MYGIETEEDFLKFHQRNLVKLKAYTDNLSQRNFPFSILAKMKAKREIDTLINQEAKLYGIRYDLDGTVHAISTETGVNQPSFADVLTRKNDVVFGI